jgi:hypothetical protein
MRRIFTISFSFQQNTHTALVIIGGENNDLTIQVQVPDSSLHDLIAEGKVSYSSQQGLSFTNKGEKHQALELVGSITRALEKCLYDTVDS